MHTGYFKPYVEMLVQGTKNLLCNLFFVQIIPKQRCTFLLGLLGGPIP